jgi:hypothetical protein
MVEVVDCGGVVVVDGRGGVGGGGCLFEYIFLGVAVGKMWLHSVDSRFRARVSMCALPFQIQRKLFKGGKLTRADGDSSDAIQNTEPDFEVNTTNTNLATHECDLVIMTRVSTMDFFPQKSSANNPL